MLVPGGSARVSVGIVSLFYNSPCSAVATGVTVASTNGAVVAAAAVTSDGATVAADVVGFVFV